MLALMDLESGKTVWADSTFAGDVRLKPDATGNAVRLKPDTTGNNTAVPNDSSVGSVRLQPDQTEKSKPREVRWGMPIVSDDGALVIAAARAADNKDRWLVAVDAAGTQSRVIDVLHDDAWVKKWEIESVALSLDRQKFYINSTEAHPGERHIYSMPVDGGQRTNLTSMTGASAGEVSPDDRTIGFV